DFYKRSLLEKLLYYFFIAGSIIVIPSAVGGLVFGEWLVALIDVFSYIIIAWLYLAKKTSIHTKKIGVISILCFIGVLILLVLGPYGAGFIWLFAFTSFAALFFEFKGSLIAHIVTLIFFVLLLVLKEMGFLTGFLITDYDIIAFTLTFLNFLAVSFLINMALIYLITNQYLSMDRKSKLAALFRRKNEQLSKKNNELDKLVYSISHDIRAPLANIIGLTNIAKMEAHKADVGLYLEKIEESANRLQNFTEKVILFFKEGKVKSRSTNIYLFDFIEKLALNYLRTLEKNEYKLTLNISKNTQIKVNEIGLEIILNNLINNSIKYRNKNKVLEVVISVTLLNGNCEIVVKDNGIGIPSNKLPYIFD